MIHTAVPLAAATGVLPSSLPRHICGAIRSVVRKLTIAASAVLMSRCHFRGGQPHQLFMLFPYCPAHPQGTNEERQPRR